VNEGKHDIKDIRMGDGLRKSVKFRPNSALAIAIEDLVRK
jgi:hypothetical protein